MKTLVEDDIIDDTRIFQTITPDQVKRYLRSHGWQEEAVEAKVWTKNKATLHIPCHGPSVFYALEMEHMISDLARFERCSSLALVEDMGGSLQL
jgi:hypothetical protein